MDAVPTRGQGDIDAAVDEQLDGRVRGARGYADGARELEERLRVEVLLAQLDPVDAGGDECSRDPGERGKERPVRDEAESRACDQNSASPSRGLDAVAYRRRGIRPDS